VTCLIGLVKSTTDLSFWDILYGTVVGFGVVYAVAYEDPRRDPIGFGMWIFTFFLVAYFFYYDRYSPGFAYKYEDQPFSLLVLNFAILLSFVFLFVEHRSPLNYILCISILYFFDMLWCKRFGKVLHERGTIEETKINDACAIFDGMTAFVFTVFFIFGLFFEQIETLCIFLALVTYVTVVIFEFLFQAIISLFR
jgi:hypothetical protein